MDHSIEISQAVHANPARVWAVLSDLDGAPQNLSGIDRIERIEGPAFGVGTSWRETRTLWGKSQTEVLTVTAVEPNQSVTIESDSRGVHYVTRFTLTEVGDETDLSMFFSGVQVVSTRWSRVLWKVFGAVGMKASAKMMRKELIDIAAVAERKE